jgi:hypothetical protein
MSQPLDLDAMKLWVKANNFTRSEAAPVLVALIAALEESQAEVERLRAALEEIAEIRCGIVGHAVAVGCGAPAVALRAVSHTEETPQ